MDSNGPPPPPRRPNIVFVFPDQFRQHAVGFMHADPVVTPNLDRFAAQSLVLTHAISNFPVCSPYRAMLLTGQYPFGSGVIGNCNSQNNARGIFLKLDARCLSDVLDDAGYFCGYVGKWHLDAPDPAHEQFTEGRRGDGLIWDGFTPPDHRHSFRFWHSYGCCDNHLSPHYWVNQARVDQPLDVSEWSVQHETGVAVDFIANRGGAMREPDKPFALFVSYNPPHTPFKAVPEKYLDAYAGKTTRELLNRPNVRFEGRGAEAEKWAKHYFAAISGIDEQFARIITALNDANLTDDTIVVFTSDHGEMMGSQGLMNKQVWFNESLRVPFAIRWPGKIQPGRNNVLLSAPDIMPTLLGLCGLTGEIPASVQGADRSANLLGTKTAQPDSALYLWIDEAAPAQRGCRGIVTGRHTFVIDRRETQACEYLYDNERDPYQMNNLAASEPALAESCRAETQRWLERTGDPWRV
jgi:arylsulfatase A-like enzyme